MFGGPVQLHGHRAVYALRSARVEFVLLDRLPLPGFLRHRGPGARDRAAFA